MPLGNINLRIEISRRNPDKTGIAQNAQQIFHVEHMPVLLRHVRNIIYGIYRAIEKVSPFVHGNDIGEIPAFQIGPNINRGVRHSYSQTPSRAQNAQALVKHMAHFR